MSQRDPYAEVVAAIAAMSHTKQFGAETVRVYIHALRDVPIDELRAVVWDLVKTRVHPPAIAEVLAAVAERRLQLPGPNAAWDMVNDRDLPRSQMPDAVVRAMDSFGGRHAFRTSENATALRAQFIRAYQEYADAERLDTVRALEKPKRQRREVGGAA